MSTRRSPSISPATLGTSQVEKSDVLISFHSKEDHVPPCKESDGDPSAPVANAMSPPNRRSPVSWTKSATASLARMRELSGPKTMHRQSGSTSSRNSSRWSGSLGRLSEESRSGRSKEVGVRAGATPKKAVVRSVRPVDLQEAQWHHVESFTQRSLSCFPGFTLIDDNW